jgi:hypothetical protein
MKQLILILLSILIVSLYPYLAFAWDDAPYERNFMRIPRYLDQHDEASSRWIWLKKVGDHDTQIIIGRGTKHERNATTVINRSNDMIDCWDYAYFIKLTRGNYFHEDINGATYFAVVPLDITNVLIRTAIIFKLQDNVVTEFGRILNYECNKDLPLFVEKMDMFEFISRRIED